MCFNTFAAIVARNHPTKSKELLAYHSIILVEALRFSCRGWMSYCRMFREHIREVRTGCSFTQSFTRSLSSASVWRLPHARSVWAQVRVCPSSSGTPVGLDAQPSGEEYSDQPESALDVTPVLSQGPRALAPVWQSPSASSSTKGSASGTQSRVTGSTSASAVVGTTKWCIARPHLS